MVSGIARPTKIATLAALVALSACSPPGLTLSTGPEQTTIVGQLGGEMRGDAACAWIQTDSGERVEVAYPDGWRLELDPLALFDDGGHQRAKRGDTLTVSGYFAEVGASVCQPDRIFNATEVRGP